MNSFDSNGAGHPNMCRRLHLWQAWGAHRIAGPAQAGRDSVDHFTRTRSRGALPYRKAGVRGETRDGGGRAKVFEIVAVPFLFGPVGFMHQHPRPGLRDFVSGDFLSCVHSLSRSQVYC